MKGFLLIYPEGFHSGGTLILGGKCAIDIRQGDKDGQAKMFGRGIWFYHQISDLTENINLFSENNRLYFFKSEILAPLNT